MATAYDFIDRGDNCSDPPSPIGKYDLLDNFINDVPSPDGSESSGLFVSPYRSREQSQSSDNDLRGRQRDRPRSLNGLFSETNSQSSRRSRSPARSTDSRETFSGFSPVRSVPNSRQQSVASTQGEGEEDPDPFQIPTHLDVEQLSGLGVPGKRLGTGGPRWSCRYYLLTVAQSGINWPWEKLVEILDNLGAKCRIGRERHSDGGYHYHTFVDFERKFDTENPHRFCVGTRRPGSTAKCPGQAHINICPVRRTPFNAYNYVTKDVPDKGGVLVHESPNFPSPPVRGSGASRDDKWQGSLQLSSGNEFSEDVKLHSPRDWCLYGKQIQNAIERRYGKDPIEPTRPDPQMGLTIHWERYPVVRQWVLANLPDPHAILTSTGGYGYQYAGREQSDLAYLERRGTVPQRPKSLILHGGSKLGKSDFSRGLGPVCYFEKNFNLKKLLGTGVANIIATVWSDVHWKNPALKNEGFKTYFGGQKEFEANDRYERNITIRPYSLPAIVLTNKDPAQFLDDSDYAWLTANCTIVDMGPLTPDRRNAISSATIHESAELELPEL